MIKLHPRDESDLLWFLNDEYKGDMGCRSTQGGIQDTLERGTPLGGSGRSAGISDRAMTACARLKRILPRFRRLSDGQRTILRAAFVSRSDQLPLCYGERPNAALGCGDVIELYRLEGHTDLIRMPAWLWSLPANTTHKKATVRAEATKLIETIRSATERELVQALQAYGADVAVPATRTPGQVTLTDLMASMHMDRRTVLKHLHEAGVAVETRKGAPTRVPMRQLKVRWPEAAMSLTEAVA